jgi:hypothetical protein
MDVHVDVKHHANTDAYERSLFPLMIRVRDMVDETVVDLGSVFCERNIDYPVDTGNMRAIHLGARNGCLNALYNLLRVAKCCSLNRRAFELEQFYFELLQRYTARCNEQGDGVPRLATWTRELLDEYRYPERISRGSTWNLTRDPPGVREFQYEFLAELRLWSGASRDELDPRLYLDRVLHQTMHNTFFGSVLMSILSPDTVADDATERAMKSCMNQVFRMSTESPVLLGALVPLAHKQLDAAALERIRQWDPEIDRGFTSSDLPDNAPLLAHWRAFHRCDRVRALVTNEVTSAFIPVLAELIARFVVG